MGNYLVDTNCLVLCYQTGKQYKTIKDLIFSPANIIHILELCIPEVISIFYKQRYGNSGDLQQTSEVEMRDMINKFISDVRAAKYLVHPVMSREIIKTDDVWKKAEVTYKELVGTTHSFLCALDAILLALDRLKPNRTIL